MDNPFGIGVRVRVIGKGSPFLGHEGVTVAIPDNWVDNEYPIAVKLDFSKVVLWPEKRRDIRPIGYYPEELEAV